MAFRTILTRALGCLTYRDGLAIVPGGLSHQWPERQFLRRLLTRLDVDCVFDVGANVGQYGAELRIIGYRGLIVSFEPDPVAFRELRARAMYDPRWRVFNIALGGTAGPGELNVMADSRFNSFRMPSVDETTCLRAANTVVNRITVPIATISQMLPWLQGVHGFKRPYLKMDTQGSDVDIFRGAADVHDRFVAFQSELSHKRLYHGVPLWTTALAEYEAAGFELVGVYAVNPGLGALLESNCYLERVKRRRRR